MTKMNFDVSSAMAFTTVPLNSEAVGPSGPPGGNLIGHGARAKAGVPSRAVGPQAWGKLDHPDGSVLAPERDMMKHRNEAHRRHTDPRGRIPGRPRCHALTVLAAAFLAAACGPSREERDALRALEQQAMIAVDAEIAALDSLLAPLPRLTRSEQGELRRHLNEEQVATARKLGVDAPVDRAAVMRMVEQGALVQLEDSTRFWIVRELDHSMPYVTPDTRSLIAEIGRRFHDRLDSLGLPAFRFEISSVLRTAELQARLRNGNSNASRTTSSHEFGTTVDVAYNEFSAPADYELPPPARPVESDVVPELTDRVAPRALLALDELATARAGELQGVLGRVILELQREGAVHPLYERGQPVFHMTVATRFPHGAADRVLAE